MAGLVSALVTLTILLKVGHLLQQLPRVKFLLNGFNEKNRKQNSCHVLNTTSCLHIFHIGT